MVTGPRTIPLGRRQVACLGAVAALCASACANIWGFSDLGNAPDGGGTGGASVMAPGGSGGGRIAETGAGGAPSRDDDGGAGAGGAGGSGGSGGLGASGGSGGAGGVAGAGGPGGGGGLAGLGGGGGAGGAAGAGGAGGLEGGGRGGAAGAGACVAGTNRCVAGDLELCSPAGIWQSIGTATRELLANPAFEQGETSWTVSVAGGFPLVYAANVNGSSAPDIAAQSPPNLAWFGGYNAADDVLTQRVVLPANAASMTVSFYYAIFTRETGAAENDVMDVQLTAGAQTIPLVHFSDNDPVDNWTHFSAPLPISLAGQTVTLQFRDTSNANAITSFYVDTVSVQVVACP